MAFKLLKQNEKIAYVYLFVLLFTSVDTLIFGTNANTAFLYVPRIVAALGIFLIHMLSIKKIILNRSTLFCSLFILIIILSGVTNGSDFNTVFSRFLFIAIGYLVITQVGKKIFFQCFDDFLLLVSIFALLLELIAYIFPNALTIFPTIVNESGTQFYSIYVASLMKSMVNVRLIRCSGIFWEPGAFATYLIIGLINQFFMQEKIKIGRVVLYSICLLLTFSTAGIISFAFLLLSLLFFKKSSLPKKIKRFINAGVVISILLVMALLLFGQNSSLYETLFSKIINNNSSARTRWASLIVPFYIAFDYPLLGTGPNLVFEMMRTYAGKSTLGLQASKMLTNTITYQFATYGLFYGALFFFGIVLFAKKCSLKSRSALTFFFLVIALMMAFSAEAFFSFVPFILVFCGIDNTGKEKVKYRYNENSSNKLITTW